MFDEKKIESLCTRDMILFAWTALQLLHAVENLQVEEAENTGSFLYQCGGRIKGRRRRNGLSGLDPLPQADRGD